MAEQNQPKANWARCNFLQASEKELVWVLRISVVAAGIFATTLSIAVKSVFVLFFLCADFVFLLLFPQVSLCIYAGFLKENVRYPV